MSDDILQRATKALREQGGAEPPTDRAAFMRARVLSQAKRSSRLRPQGIWQWAAVVSLGFFATTAMAQVIAVQLPKVIEALRREPVVEEAKPKKPARPPQPRAAKPIEPTAPIPSEPPIPAEPPAPSVLNPPPSQPAQDAAVAPTPSPRQGKRAAPKRSASASLPPPPSLAPAVIEPEPAPAPEAPPPAEQATNAPAEAAPAPSLPPKAAAPEPAELALFRRAQALHLQHDPRAIDAWDAFLRVAGASALAPEARYNRALGLVRAGRFGEARKALQPFAEGKYGSYRKQEASSLLARLRK